MEKNKIEQWKEDHPTRWFFALVISSVLVIGTIGCAGIFTVWLCKAFWVFLNSLL